MNAISRAAQALGRKARGVPKKFTQADIKRRTERLALARAKRWPKTTTKSKGQRP